MARKKIGTEIRSDKDWKKTLRIQYLAHDHYDTDVSSFKKATIHVDSKVKKDPDSINVIVDVRDDRSANYLLRWREKAPKYRQLIFKIIW